MMDNELSKILKDVKDVHTFKPQKGDAILVMAKNRLSSESIKRISDNFTAVVPEGVKIIIVDSDMDVKMLKRCNINKQPELYHCVSECRYPHENCDYRGGVAANYSYCSLQPHIPIEMLKK